MATGVTKRKSSKKSPVRSRQVNFRIADTLYRALEAVAVRERRSIAQTAHHLLEAGLRTRAGERVVDDTSASHIADLAAAGGSFDWLAKEPDLYDENSGEPI